VDELPASIPANVQPKPGDMTAWMTATDGPLNVVLFVPLGFFLALLLRRPISAALLCVALSLAIECYQASLTSRVGAFADASPTPSAPASARWPRCSFSWSAARRAGRRPGSVARA
jgi:hypothetical protein